VVQRAVGDQAETTGLHGPPVVAARSADHQQVRVERLADELVRPHPQELGGRDQRGVQGHGVRHGGLEHAQPVRHRPVEADAALTERAGHRVHEGQRTADGDRARDGVGHHGVVVGQRLQRGDDVRPALGGPVDGGAGSQQ
jgi:hypothetical protein